MPRCGQFLVRFVKAIEPEVSLVSRPSPPPVLDRLQFLHTASDQKLEAGMPENETIKRGINMFFQTLLDDSVHIGFLMYTVSSNMCPG